MKVWVAVETLTYSWYPDDHKVVAVFSTYEKAEKWCLAQNGQVDWHEFEIDELDPAGAGKEE